MLWSIATDNADNEMIVSAAEKVCLGWSIISKAGTLFSFKQLGFELIRQENAEI